MHRLVAFPISLLLTVTALAGDLPIRPDTKLTPGAVLTSDAATVCMRGYAKTVHHTSGKLKGEIYREYGCQFASKLLRANLHAWRAPTYTVPSPGRNRAESGLVWLLHNTVELEELVEEEDAEMGEAD